MYPAFTTTRPRLPSVLSVSQPIEQYRTELSKRSLLRNNAIADVESLDAYLAHLFLEGHPGDPVLIDLAAESTAGASMLVGLLHPRQPRVFAVGGAYRGALEDFLQRQDKPLSHPRWLSSREPAAELHGETDVILFVDGNRPAVDEEVEHWLNALPLAVVLIFGLGAVGDCAAIDALLQRFPSGSRRRFTLLRDRGEVLSASRLGLVADRDNPSAEIALARLQQLFTNNYSFLGLLRSVTEQAIRSTASDAIAREGHGLFLEWNNEINQLKQTARQARENAAMQTEELNALRRSTTFRLSERLRRWRRQYVPERSWRYRLFHVLRRAAQIGRRDGLRGVLRRIAHRCFRRQA